LEDNHELNNALTECLHGAVDTALKMKRAPYTRIP
jgi:hypothetical protein